LLCSRGLLRIKNRFPYFLFSWVLEIRLIQLPFFAIFIYETD